MKKLVKVLGLICVCFALICAAGFFVACNEDEVVSISIKNDFIKGDYYVGEEFDPTGAYLIVKTKGGDSYELAVSSDEVSVENFSTQTIGQSKSAILIYKGCKCPFVYSVSLKNLDDVSLVSETLTYNGKNQMLNCVNQAKELGITVTVTYADGDNAGEDASAGVKDYKDGGYKLHVIYSKPGYTSKEANVTLTIAKAQVGVELIFLPQNLSAERVAQINAGADQSFKWYDPNNEVWQNVSYYEGAQLFPRIKLSDAPEADRQMAADPSNKWVTLGRVVDFTAYGVNSGGSINGIGTYKVKILSANANYNVVVGTDNFFTFQVVKANSNLVGTTGKSLVQIVEQATNFNGSNVELTRTGSSTFSISGLTTGEIKDPNVESVSLVSSPEYNFTINSNETVTVTVVYTFANYTNVELTRTFSKNAIIDYNNY